MILRVLVKNVAADGGQLAAKTYASPRRFQLSAGTGPREGECQNLPFVPATESNGVADGNIYFPGKNWPTRDG